MHSIFKEGFRIWTSTLKIEGGGESGHCAVCLLTFHWSSRSPQRAGVSENICFIILSGYRLPSRSMSTISLRICATSSGVKAIFDAAIFSLRYYKRHVSDISREKGVIQTFGFFVPGMGMISFPCASSHAKVTWLAFALYFSPTFLIPSTRSRILGKLLSLNLTQ